MVNRYVVESPVANGTRKKDLLKIKSHVSQVLNVHVNESKKKSTFFRKIFFPSSEKLTFEKENVIFQNIFSNFNLFYLIVVNFL